MHRLGHARWLLALLWLVACGPRVQELRSSRPRELHPKVSPGAQAALAAGNRAFAVDLYRALGSGGNLALSPHGLASALAMGYAGAHGRTREQMRQAMHISLADDELARAFGRVDRLLAYRSVESKHYTDTPFALSVVNGAWAQQGFHFERAYLDTLAVSFGTGVNLVDFKRDAANVREAINEWVSDRTHERIEELLPQGSIDDRTRLVLTNAVTMDALWKEPLEAERTASGIFHAATSDVTVPMMHGSMKGRFARGEGYDVAFLPFLERDVGLLLIVPDPGTFAAFDAALQASTLQQASGLTQGSCAQLDLSLPRFELSSANDMVPPLQQLGMVDAFDRERADFYGMTGAHDLAISQVEQRALVHVDERGMRAAAGSAVTMIEVSACQGAALRVDRPFLFAVLDEPTGTLLFFGRVVDPS